MPSYVRGRTNGRLLSDEQIAEAYASGETADMIGQRAGCCSVTILEIVRRAGVQVRKPGKGTPARLAISDSEIVRRYRDGETGPQIAHAAGCSAGVIYRILRSLDIPIRAQASNLRRAARRVRANG